MPTPRALDQDALRVALLAGHTHAKIAADFGVSTRTVKRERARARAEHGAGWPRVSPRAKPRVPAPSSDPLPRGQALAPAPGGRLEGPFVLLEPPPENADPDQLEAWACRALVAEASGPGKDRVSAAKALIELSERRRARKPVGEDQPDPVVAAEAVRLAIEVATENVNDGAPELEPVPDPAELPPLPPLPEWDGGDLAL